MPRSPHASHLHPKWGKDLAWMRRIGAITERPQPAGQMVIETVVEVAPRSLSTPLQQRQPKRQPKQQPRVRKSKPVVLRPLPCINLGAVVARAGSCCPRNNTHTCNAGRGNVKPAIECETCTTGYVPDTDSNAND